MPRPGGFWGASSPVRPSALCACRAARRSLVNVALVAVISVACLVLVPFWRPVGPATGAPTGLVGDAPSGITGALKAIVRPGHHVLNPQPWGSWVEFAVPDGLVTLDSRIELFPATVWEDYDRVWHGAEGWQEILTGWQVDVVVATKDDRELVDRLVSAGWHIDYADNDGSILVGP